MTKATTQPARTRSKGKRTHIAPRRGKRRGRMPVRRELSAGGVVLRKQGEQWMVALLKTEHKRGEVWVLPKGHVEREERELVSDAARREVQEEAGLRDLSVKNQLGVSRFRFQAEDAVVHKTVHYYLMTTKQLDLTPQEEEGLIDAAWFPIAEALKKLEYDTDQEVVRRAHDKVMGRTRSARLRDRRERPRGKRQLRIHT